MAETPLSFYFVDDDTDALEFIALILSAAGHTVHTQSIGLYAISEIVRIQPDCVLLDLVMAGIDGLELCRELRARPELDDITIVFVTSKSGAEWERRAADAGANGFFSKPVDPRGFPTAVEKIVAAHRTLND